MFVKMTPPSLSIISSIFSIGASAETFLIEVVGVYESSIGGGLTECVDVMFRELGLK
jgi:hypothetical protein